MADETPDTTGEEAASGDIPVKRADFAELQQTEVVGTAALSHLKDVKFELEAVLGRTVLPVEDILKLGTGSVVELNRPIHEDIDLVVQGVKVASGEVVVVDDSFAIRIKEVSDPDKK